MSTNPTREYYPLVQIIGNYSSSCGYCKSPEDNRRRSKKGSFGIYGSQIPASVYDSLLNRNWRRCGDLFYWPRNDSICCPQYAIRLRASDFDARKSKHHRKVMNRLQRFLSTGSVESRQQQQQQQQQEDMMGEESSEQSSENGDESSGASVHQCSAAVAAEIRRAVRELFQSGEDQEPSVKRSIVPLDAAKHGFDVERAVSVVAPNKKKMKKRKGRMMKAASDLSCNVVLIMMGLYRKHGLLDGNDGTPLTAKLVAEKIVQHLRLDVLQREHGVGSVQVADNGFINFTMANTRCQHGLDQKQQQQPEQKMPSGPRQKKRKQSTKAMEISDADTAAPAKHQLTLEIQPAVVRDDEFALYKKYQIAVHHDEPHKVTRSGYDDFLCSSALVLEQSQEDEQQNGSDKYPFKGYGTYHVRYMLDETKLIAVSVVDVLPTGWSSVYFFYDPDYSHLSLGVVSAIKEIELVRQELQRVPEFQFMYLGYYIHSCPKMRYKAQYEPSQLLCPETSTWVPYVQVKPKLDQHKYCKFASDDTPLDVERQPSNDVDLSGILLLVQRQLLPAQVVFSQLPLTDKAKEKMEEFHRLASREVAKQVVHVLNINSDFALNEEEEE